jgi:hypothetical protein
VQSPFPAPLPDPAVCPAGAFPGWSDSSARQAGPARARAGRAGWVRTRPRGSAGSLTAHKPFENLAAAPGKVDHVDMYYNAGHPGVAEPHYHVVIWYVSPEKAAAVK